MLSSEELDLQFERIVVVLLEHDEVEGGNEDGEGGDDEGDQHDWVRVQDQRVFVVHGEQEVKMDRELGEVLVEEGVGSHELSERDRLFENRDRVIDAERIKHGGE